MTKEEKFEQLFKDYWLYVYEFEVGYPEDFKPEPPYREDFKLRLYEDGMAIKVNEGY